MMARVPQLQDVRSRLNHESHFTDLATLFNFRNLPAGRAKCYNDLVASGFFIRLKKVFWLNLLLPHHHHHLRREKKNQLSSELEH